MCSALSEILRIIAIFCWKIEHFLLMNRSETAPHTLGIKLIYPYWLKSYDLFHCENRKHRKKILEAWGEALGQGDAIVEAWEEELYEKCIISRSEWEKTLEQGKDELNSQIALTYLINNLKERVPDTFFSMPEAKDEDKLRFEEACKSSLNILKAFQWRVVDLGTSMEGGWKFPVNVANQKGSVLIGTCTSETAFILEIFRQYWEGLQANGNEAFSSSSKEDPGAFDIGKLELEAIGLQVVLYDWNLATLEIDYDFQYRGKLSEEGMGRIPELREQIQKVLSKRLDEAISTGGADDQKSDRNPIYYQTEFVFKVITGLYPMEIPIENADFSSEGGIKEALETDFRRDFEQVIENLEFDEGEFRQRYRSTLERQRRNTKKLARILDRMYRARARGRYNIFKRRIKRVESLLLQLEIPGELLEDFLEEEGGNVNEKLDAYSRMVFLNKKIKSGHYLKLLPQYADKKIENRKDPSFGYLRNFFGFDLEAANETQSDSTLVIKPFHENYQMPFWYAIIRIDEAILPNSGRGETVAGFQRFHAHAMSSGQGFRGLESIYFDFEEAILITKSGRDPNGGGQKIEWLIRLGILYFGGLHRMNSHLVSRMGRHLELHSSTLRRLYSGSRYKWKDHVLEREIQRLELMQIALESMVQESSPMFVCDSAILMNVYEQFRAATHFEKQVAAIRLILPNLIADLRSDLGDRLEIREKEKRSQLAEIRKLAIAATVFSVGIALISISHSLVEIFDTLSAGGSFGEWPDLVPMGVAIALISFLFVGRSRRWIISIVSKAADKFYETYVSIAKIRAERGVRRR